MARWINMRALHEHQPGWFETTHLSAVRRAAAQVAARTGCVAWTDLLRKEVSFGFVRNGEECIVWSCPLFKAGCRSAPNRFDPVTDPMSVDDVVRVIELARIPRETKERWAAQNRRAKEHDKDEAFNTMVDDDSRELERTMERTYEKHTMGRHYRRFHDLGA